MCVRAFVVLMQCTLAHHIKFVRASCVKFHTLLNNNKGQIRLNLISHVFTLNMNFPGYQFLVEKSMLNGRNGTVFALRFCGPPFWMRERTRSRIKSRPSDSGQYLNILILRKQDLLPEWGHRSTNSISINSVITTAFILVKLVTPRVVVLVYVMSWGMGHLTMQIAYTYVG